jgi:excinuclease ABC subunit A
LVVEHDRDVIAGSDYLCDFGPRAGRYGGRIVAQGPPQNVQPNAHSVTAGYLTHQRSIPLPYQRRPVVDAQGKMLTHLLTIKGARENNLRGIDVSFPTGALTAVTGPSGSGKSSLVEDILYPALARKLHRAMVKPGRHDSIEGQQYIEKVIRVDQSPLGNSPTSNPATYTGVFDFIRQLFAELPESMARGFTQRAFSFNVTGGRCEACEGSGQRKIEMHFLPDVWIICEECQGQRYRQDVLEVKYHGHSINDVLNLQCGDAIELFADHARITRTLQTLCDVGLDYITLGQSARDLSGGEAQRVKLASELARPGASSTLYLLDEPTTGLHFEDIRRLLTVMQRLVDQGNTMIVIEHNLEVIKSADWIIDIGPGAGVHGGRLVFAGTPEQMAGTVPDKKSRNKMPAPDSATLSSTAAYVKQALELSQPASAPELVATITKTNPQRAQVASSTLRIDPPHTEEIKKRPVFQPWRALGRRWHLLNRGFPANRQPQWPIEMVEPVLLLCEQIAGGQSLIFDKPNRVRVQTSDQRDWADIETKNPEALRLSLNGTAQGLDLDLLQQLGVDGPVAIESREQVRITLQLQCLDQVLDVRLRDFLAHHFAHQAKAIGS